MIKVDEQKFLQFEQKFDGTEQVLEIWGFRLAMTL